MVKRFLPNPPNEATAPTRVAARRVVVGDAVLIRAIHTLSSIREGSTRYGLNLAYYCLRVPAERILR